MRKLILTAIIYCDHCDAAYSNPINVDPLNMHQAAMLEGWQANGGSHTCPACLAREDEKREQDLAAVLAAVKAS